MVRKNIWDILENQEIDLPKEYISLWNLFHNKEIIRDQFGYPTTFKNAISSTFLHFKKRGSYTSYKDLLLALEVSYKGYETKLEDLDLLIELIILMISELDDLDVQYEYAEGKGFILNNILSILKKTNQKVITLEGKGEIVVPDDEAVTIVADLILPDDEKLALEVLGYSHFSNKDNLEEKRKILHRLANYLEPKFNISKSDEIKFVLNNYYIRHGNEKNKRNITKLGNEKTAELYDKLYRDILYYILKQEHNEFKVLIKELKKDL